MTVAADPDHSSPEAELVALRQAMEAVARRPEAEAVQALSGAPQPSADQAERIALLAERLATGVRQRRRGSGGVDALMNEFSLGSSEGVALMCLAEALLRVPDDDARLRLIRDKLRARDWSAHVGHSPSLFVNAAAWSLALTGRLLAPDEAEKVPHALQRIAVRGGEALLREAMDYAMRLVGQQFVLGETIEAALECAATGAAADYRYSFDMLGEAAVTADEAARYATAYAHAIHAIGRHDRWRGVHKGNGISIKQIAYAHSGNLLKEVNLFDVYADEKLGAGKKSYAVSFLLRDEQKTLTDADIDKVMDQVAQQFQSKLNAHIRKWNERPDQTNR